MSDSEKDSTTGSCLCGGVRFRIDGRLAPIQVCHCSQCRKAQGSAFATNIPVAAKDFKLLQGHQLLAVYESSPGKLRSHCRRCGSPIMSRKDTVPGMLRIRAGTLDGEPSTSIAFHMFVGSKATWWPIHDDSPQHQAAFSGPTDEE